MRSRSALMLQVIFCLGITTPSIAVTIADSEADWSFDGVQGENGWHNGWYNLTQDDDATYSPDEFTPFLNDDSGFVEPDGLNHWNGTGWNLYRDTAATAGVETGPWTIVDPLHGHPNGINSAAPILVDEPEQAEHWPIRRWVSTYAGEVSAISSIADANLGCGTGTSVELYHNGVLIDKLSTASAAELTNTVGATLAVGDFLDLALTPEGIDGDRADPCDSTNFRLRVTDDPPPPPPAPPLADSNDDWSTTGTQGERNWSNGFYNLTADSDGVYQMDDFTPFTNSAGPAGGPVDPDDNHWTGTQWDLTTEASGPWTELGRANTHPNGTNSAPNDEHWTIRRYVANDLASTTPVEVTWETAKTNIGGGNGVTGVLLVNGEQVDSATIPFNDALGVSRKFYLNLQPGDVIDLALTPNDNDGADGSRNRLTLRTSLPDGTLYNPGEVIADSIAEFSEEQGQDNWFFGYYDQLADAEDGDGTYATDEFIPFLNDGSGVVSDDPALEGWKDSENHWDGTKWDLLNNGAPGADHGPWTELTDAGGHPAANAQGDVEVHWAIRRWVSEESGDFLIKGQLNNISPSGDGTVGRILVDGNEVWSALSNGTSEEIDVLVTLDTGSIVDFAIDPDGAGNFDPADPSTIGLVNDGSDGTNFWFAVSRPLLFTPGLAGDFNGNGLLDAGDIDDLTGQSAGGLNPPPYDLNSDALVNGADVNVWVKDLFNSWIGDANLDGQFNSSDLVVVLASGTYEVDVAAVWSTGDFNGDGRTTSADLVAALADGGYELGPRAAVASVPEPAGFGLIGSGLLLLLQALRKRRS